MNPGAATKRRAPTCQSLSIGLIAVTFVVGGCAGLPRASLVQSRGAPSAASSPSANADPTVSPGALNGFVVFARAGGQYGDETLFMANADGTHEQQLTPNGESCCLRISPDAKRLVYSYYPPDARRVTVAIQSLEDGTQQEIPLPDDTANLGAGAWSPDGTHLALQLWDDNDHTRDGIYTVRADDGGGLTRLTHAERADIPADYSPDGTKLIIFRESDVQSVGTLSILDLESGQLRPLSPVGMQVGWGTARYSPDGKTILFQDSRVSATGALWSINPDGGALTKLFEDAQGRFASHPTWSPDGTMIMFALNPVADDFEHRPNGTYIIDADGSDLRMVLSGDDFRREFEWKPSPVPNP
jgi:Tol biopolymer transport system component